MGGDYIYSGGKSSLVLPTGETGVQINAINDYGVMVGTYTGSDGSEYGFEVTSVPEPGAFYVLLIGLCGIASRRIWMRSPGQPL